MADTKYVDVVVRMKTTNADQAVGQVTDKLNDMGNVGSTAAAKVVAGNKNMGSSLMQSAQQFGLFETQAGRFFKQFYEGTSTAVKGLGAVKGAMAATGIGLLMVAVGLLVANWDKLNKTIDTGTKAMSDHEKTIRELRIEYDLLTGVITAQQAEMEKLQLQHELSLEEIKIDTEKQTDAIFGFWDKLWFSIRAGLTDVGQATAAATKRHEEELKKINEEANKKRNEKQEEYDKKLDIIKAKYRKKDVEDTKKTQDEVDKFLYEKRKAFIEKINKLIDLDKKLANEKDNAEALTQLEWDSYRQRFIVISEFYDKVDKLGNEAYDTDLWKERSKVIFDSVGEVTDNGDGLILENLREYATQYEWEWYMLQTKLSDISTSELNARYEKEKELLVNKRTEGLITEEEYRTQEADLTAAYDKESYDAIVKAYDEKLDYEKYLYDKKQQLRDQDLAAEEAYSMTMRSLQNSVADGVLTILDAMNYISGESKSMDLMLLAMEKAYAIADLWMNTYTANQKFKAQLGVGGFGVAALNTVMAGVQTAAIIASAAKGASEINSAYKKKSSKKEYGGFVSGSSHSNGGVNINAEGGEYVVNKRSMTDPALAAMVMAANSAGLPGSMGMQQTQQQPIKVYIVESELREFQNKVAIRESKFVN